MPYLQSAYIAAQSRGDVMEWSDYGVIRCERPHSWRWLVWLVVGAMIAGLYVAPGLLGLGQ